MLIVRWVWQGGDTVLLSPWITSFPATISTSNTGPVSKHQSGQRKRIMSPTGRTIFIIENFLHRGFPLSGIYMRNKCVHTIAHPESPTQIACLLDLLNTNFPILLSLCPWPADQSGAVLSQCRSVTRAISPSKQNRRPDTPLKVLPTEWHCGALTVHFQLILEYSTEMHEPANIL